MLSELFHGSRFSRLRSLALGELDLSACPPAILQTLHDLTLQLEESSVPVFLLHGAWALERVRFVYPRRCGSRTFPIVDLTQVPSLQLVVFEIRRCQSATLALHSPNRKSSLRLPRLLLQVTDRHPCRRTALWWWRHLPPRGRGMRAIDLSLWLQGSPGSEHRLAEHADR